MGEEFKQKIQAFKIPIALSLVGIVLIIGGLILDPSQPKTEFPEESLVEGEKFISVDVSGAVNKPGVYQLKENSRVEDAVVVAGGFSADSNSEYVSKSINLAQKLVDGTKIYIPFRGEAGATVVAGVAGSSTTSIININSATQKDLESLSGIGPVTAGKIISNRPYSKIEDLISKKVIGKAVFDKIKNEISVY